MNTVKSIAHRLGTKGMSVILTSVLAIGLFFVSTGVSFAVDPTIDYASLASTTRNDVITAVNSFLPVVFGFLAIMIGLGLAYRWIQRVAHSS